MTDIDAVHAAIIADPDDDLPRLAFADLLEERGDDARAEFIRTQIEYAALRSDECACGFVPMPACDVCRLKARELELWERKGGAGEWLIPAAGFPLGYSDLVPQNNLCSSRTAPAMVWRRGFPDEFRCPTADWREHGPRLVREHPIRTVRLTDVRAGYWDTDDRYYLAHANDPDAHPGHPRGFLHRLAESVPGLRGPFPSADAVFAATSEACLAWAKAAPL